MQSPPAPPIAASAAATSLAPPIASDSALHRDSLKFIARLSKHTSTASSLGSCWRAEWQKDPDNIVDVIVKLHGAVTSELHDERFLAQIHKDALELLYVSTTISIATHTHTHTRRDLSLTCFFVDRWILAMQCINTWFLSMA
jgi:hypothetical protein